MTTIALAPPPSAPLLRRGERLGLAVQLSLALAAACLLAVAVGWRLLIPADRALSDLVAGGAALLVAIPVIAAAWESLSHPSLHGITDRLIALALVGAWASGDLLTAAILPIVMILGHVLEERSLLGSQEAIRALSRLTQSGARRLMADGSVENVAASALRPGDRIELRAGDRVPADGVVRRGAASLDLASLTGESIPVDIGVGDIALAGAVNTDGLLEVELTRVGKETTLGRIIALMRAAEGAKPPITRLLDRHAGHYMLLVLLIAAGSYFVSGDIGITLAVLVAACPCALVLAAPAAAVAAIAVAARHGILIKGTAFLERLAEVTSVVFDKTGTITTGELRLTEARPAEGVPPDHLLRLGASLGAASSHPVSRAAAAVPGERAELTDTRELGGFGLTALLDGEVVALGRPDLFARLGVTAPQPPAHDGPIAGVSQGGRFLGWLLFADEARPGARAAVAELRGLGLGHQLLLTGDRLAVAERIAVEVGIESVCAEALPEQKMARVLAEIAAGHTPLVVGDGINDSLALKAGAVGIAMGAQGADVALASADLVLMTSDLGRLATCIRLSRRCRRTIHVNVAIGLGWTVVIVAMAAIGGLGAEGAIVAALLHNASTLAGVANAGRLLLFDETRPATISIRPQDPERARRGEGA
jgi:heavy metal translocating P-type ATPase